MFPARLGSREAVLFQGPSKNKRIGVVVFANSNITDEIRNVVADFARHQYVFVLNSCFVARINASTRSQFYKDETAYGTLENVQYECDEKNICRRNISRFTKLLEVTYFDHQTMAIKCLCVISPDGQCYTDVAGLVQCDPKIISHNITRNVTFSCWLCFDWTPEFVNVTFLDDQIPEQIKYRFGNFIAVEPEHFELASDVTWNQQMNVASSTYLSNDDISTALSLAEQPDPAPVSNVVGYFIYDNIVYVPSCPNFSVRLAWHKYTKLSDEVAYTKVEPGCPLKMDFQYNSFIKKHVVFCAEIDETYFSIQAQICDDEIVEKFLSMKLQPIQWCPGFFYCLGVSNDRSGVVHDPFGYLASLYHESRIIEDVFVRYADPNCCSYTPLYVYSTSEPEITPNLLLFERPMVQLFCIATGNYYNPTMHNYNFISIEHNIRPGDFCGAQLISYDQATNTFTVVCETIEEDFRHIPAKFTNGRYEFAIQLEIIRQPVVMFYHPELGAVGFNEKMKVSIPPIKPFACAVITSQPKTRTEQNRLIVTKIVPQLEMLAGYV